MSIVCRTIFNKVESTQGGETDSIGFILVSKWFAVVWTVVLAACQGSAGNGATAIVNVQDFQGHRWVLQRIDNLSLAEYAANLGFNQEGVLRKIPQLDFDEQGHVSGNTGCNQVQGRASIVDNRLSMSPLASTRMACPGFAGELELRLSLLYATPLVISREGSNLILTNGDTELFFQLKSRVR